MSQHTIGEWVTIKPGFGFEYWDPIDFRRAPLAGKEFCIIAIKGQRIYGKDTEGRGLTTNLDCLLRNGELP